MEARQQREREGFNPRPPRKVGATFPDDRSYEDGDSFNPRPPRKVGATIGEGGARSPYGEFQSSPTS